MPKRQALWTEPALGDLRRLRQDNPQLPQLALDVAIRLEAGEDGEELEKTEKTGDLSDCRKVYLGVGMPPSHRLVYRLLPAPDHSAPPVVEIVEIIAVENRDDGYVYQLASSRLKRLPEETKKAYNKLHQRMISERAARNKPRRQLAETDVVKWVESFHGSQQCGDASTLCWRQRRRGRTSQRWWAADGDDREALMTFAQY